MATYYWVGGSGTWNNSNTTNWSATSGGAGGSGPPLSTDTVNFDSASGTGTCTTASGSACATVILNSSTLGVTLGANHTMSGTFTLTAGTLNVGNFKLSCNIFSSSNSNVRNITFGSGSIDVTGNSAIVWTNSTATNFTVTGTPTVNLTYSGSTGTRTITTTTDAVNSNMLNFNITAGSDTIAINANSRLNSLNFTGYTGTSAVNNATRVIYGDLILASGMTFAAGTSVTSFVSTGQQKITTNNVVLDFPVIFNGVGGTFQLQDNCTVGSTRTVTLTNGTLDLNSKTLSCGLFSSNNSNTRSIAFGTGNITLTGSDATIWSTATVTGLTITGTPVVNLTYSGSTGTRVVGSGAGISESMAISFNVTAGSDGFQITGGHSVKSLDFTGFSGTFVSTSANYYGNLTLSSTMTMADSSATRYFLATSGTQIITTNGVTVGGNLNVSCPGATVRFADALTMNSACTFAFVKGTVEFKSGVTLTVGVFSTSGTDQKYLQSTTAGSQATLSQASGIVNVQSIDIKDIAATGGATWNAVNGALNKGNNSGWYFSHQMGNFSPAFGW